MDPLLIEIGKTLGLPGLLLILMAHLLREATRERQETQRRFIEFLEEHSAKDQMADERIAQMLAQGQAQSTEQHQRIIEAISRLHPIDRRQG